MIDLTVALQEGQGSDEGEETHTYPSLSENFCCDDEEVLCASQQEQQTTDDTQLQFSVRAPTTTSLQIPQIKFSGT